MTNIIELCPAAEIRQKLIILKRTARHAALYQDEALTVAEHVPISWDEGEEARRLMMLVCQRIDELTQFLTR